MNILYLLYIFPAISETFIVNEITKLIDLGHDVYIAAIFDMMDEKVHEKVKRYGLLNKTHYLKHEPSFHPKGLRRKLSDYEVKKKAEQLIKNNDIISKEEVKKLMGFCLDYNQDKTNRLFLDCLDLIKFIKEKKIGHIHCHFARENLKIACAVNNTIGTPYTFTTHADDIFVNVRRDIKELSDSAKNIVTISEYNKKFMCEVLKIDENKIKVIHCGIELNEFKPVNYLYQDKIKILSIGRLVEQKGFRYLIEVCNILNKQRINFNCSILGEGKDRKELEDMINKYNLTEKVLIVGVVTQEEVMKEMDRCSVFVMPCVKAGDGYMDGIPVALIEAMAREIPVISTNISGIPELIEDGISGVLVPQRYPGAIADAIIKISKDTEFAYKIRKNGRVKVVNDFNIKKNAERLANIFKE